MSSKFCKNQLYSSYFLGCFDNKIIYYFLLFTLFSTISKFTYYFVWRILPTNSNYFTQIYLIFSVTLLICIISINLFQIQRNSAPFIVLQIVTYSSNTALLVWRINEQNFFELGISSSI